MDSGGIAGDYVSVFHFRNIKYKKWHMREFFFKEHMHIHMGTSHCFTITLTPILYLVHAAQVARFTLWLREYAS